MDKFDGAVRAIARVLRTRYPGFILGRPLVRAEIPVFTYHDVERAELAADLEFLRRNGYRTLGVEELVRARSGKGSPGRCVLLTFDDARRSFYEVALPVLREYRARAVLFAPSWWMGAASAQQAPGRELFMSWSEVRECLASGLVDVESHAHRHALVHTSSELVTFANPAALRRYDLYDWPMQYGARGDELGRPALGTPVYRAAPLLSAERRYLEPGGLTDECRQFVERAGGAEFFVRPRWQKTLRAFHAARAAAFPGRFMTQVAFRDLVASEFELSREHFRAELGHAPTYLAFPWMLGSRSSLELAKRFGIRAAFGVALDFRAERAGCSPIPVYGRFKCDWLRFLPGDGRASVLGAVGRKIAQFPKVQHLAH